MKKILIALIVSITATATFAQSEIFELCERLDGVTTVYISKAMLQFAGVSNLDCENVNISELASKLESVEIINAEGAKSKRVKEYANAYLFSDSKKYESLMRIKDKEETVNMYLRKHPKQGSEFIIFVEEPKETSIIILTGSMTMEEVVKAVKNNQ